MREKYLSAPAMAQALGPLSAVFPARERGVGQEAAASIQTSGLIWDSGFVVSGFNSLAIVPATSKIS